MFGVEEAEIGGEFSGDVVGNLEGEVEGWVEESLPEVKQFILICVS